MSNGAIKQIITIMSIFRSIIKLNHVSVKIEIPSDKERIHGVAMATQ